MISYLRLGTWRALAREGMLSNMHLTTRPQIRHMVACMYCGVYSCVGTELHNEQSDELEVRVPQPRTCFGPQKENSPHLPHMIRHTAMPRRGLGVSVALARYWTHACFPFHFCQPAIASHASFILLVSLILLEGNKQWHLSYKCWATFLVYVHVFAPSHLWPVPSHFLKATPLTD